VLKSKVVHETSKGLTKLIGELVKNVHEFFLLIFFAKIPIGCVHLVYHWFVDVVDDGVESADRIH